MFRIAHVTDPHFRSYSGWNPLRFLGKRAAGAANLLLNRTRKHKMSLLESLGQDLQHQWTELGIDHLVVTGDLGNISLEGEWRAAIAWLERYGPEPRALTVIPGNHDVYTPDVEREHAFEKVFERYQKADHRADEAAYPFVRIRGEDIAFVCVNTCVATGDLGAWGSIGDPQRKRLATILTEPSFQKRVRVVLMHHPPVVHKGAEDHNLRDREAFADVLRNAGADLVLHGHDHRDEMTWLAGPGGTQIPSVGAGSASYAGAPAGRSRYNIYEIDGRSITRIVRAHDVARDAFVEVGRELISRPVAT